MKTAKSQQYGLTLVLVVCVLVVAGCGVPELFGRQEKKTIIMPCLELVPTPTPTPVPTPTPEESASGTPIPIVTVTPEPGHTPEPTATPGSKTCANGPGVPIICDKVVLCEPNCITIINPVFYTIESSLSYSGYICTGGNISPLGNIIVQEGANQSFTISVSGGTPGIDCTGFDIWVDGALVYTYIPTGPPYPANSQTYTFPNVGEDHVIEAVLF